MSRAAVRQTGSVSIRRPSMSRTTARMDGTVNWERGADLGGGLGEAAGPVRVDRVPGDAVAGERGPDDDVVGGRDDQRRGAQRGQPVPGVVIDQRGGLGRERGGALGPLPGLGDQLGDPRSGCSA